MRVEEGIKRGVVVGMVMGMGLILMDILKVCSVVSPQTIFYKTYKSFKSKWTSLPSVMLHHIIVLALAVPLDFVYVRSIKRSRLNPF